MKFQQPIIRFIVLLLMLSLSHCEKEVNAPEKEKPLVNTTGAKFELPDGKCLFILGQANNDYMKAYLNTVRSSPTPAGFAYYTSLSTGAVQNDMPRYKAFLDKYPNTVLQLAIWTGERQWGNPGYYLDEIVTGKYDLNINALAQACKSFGKPIFIRFGYEFDGSHNAYPPNKYIAAYQYFVNKMQTLGVTNVAYVWHSWGVEAYYGRNDFPQYYPALPAGQTVTQALWYPGDEYVDWLGLSIFGTGWGNLSTNSTIQWFISFARTHQKPIMLAESAAIKTTGRPDPNWVISDTRWFEQVFNLCFKNKAVKAFTYINVDWEADNPASTWGDTQIQNATSNVKSLWITQIKSFLHAESDLYSLINYK